MQQIVVLLILALVWAAVLVPQHLRNRAESRPADSIGAFRKQLSVLERTSPASTGRAPVRFPTQALTAGPAHRAASSASTGRAVARKRRKDVLCGLLFAMGGSLVLGLLPGLGAMLGLHLVLDVLFVAYVVLLVRMRSIAEERELKVRYMPAPVRRAPEPALLLRRSGS